MNKILLSGNLGRAAEVRMVPKRDQSGETPVVNFSLAVKVGFGEQAESLWYDCSWWGERAEKVSQWLTKGRPVLVEGEPGVRQWQKRDGSGWAAAITVRVVFLELLADGRRAEGAPERERTETTMVAGGPGSLATGGTTVTARSAAAAGDDGPF
jgi:single-strand DNA-binding protein